MMQMDPSYRPSLVRKNSGGSGALPFAGSDLVLSPSQWSRHVVGMKLCECWFYWMGSLFTFTLWAYIFCMFIPQLLLVIGFEFIQERLARGLTWIQKTRFFGLILKLLWSKRLHGLLISPCRCALGIIIMTSQQYSFFINCLICHCNVICSNESLAQLLSEITQYKWQNDFFSLF